ncbi:MAG TPA: diaminopimelate decarboxylase, partial [Candidatus Omnitrophica bacterium]|nr:diaminopimelate decarboxylase [Candidatus Omnitrophota bacterium]
GKYRNLNIRGIHLHIGSQIVHNKPFLKAVKIALLLKHEKGCDFEYLNIGGGLGIIYKDEKAITADEYSKEIKSLVQKENLKLILEPGRFIVGNSGILVLAVQYLKKGLEKTFAVVDGGMNLLIRPALYSAYHEIVPVKKSGAKKCSYDIVGPVCESSDFLGLSRSLPSLKEGDKIAVLSAGAYGFTMASNYNSQPRCGEVLVRGRNAYLIREAEDYNDLIRNERRPGFLR